MRKCSGPAPARLNSASLDLRRSSKVVAPAISLSIARRFA